MSDEKASAVIGLLISTKNIYLFSSIRLQLISASVLSPLRLWFLSEDHMGWGLLIPGLQWLLYPPGGRMRIDTIIASSALSLTPPSFVDSTDSLSLTWKHIRIKKYTDTFPLRSSVAGTIIWGKNQILSLHGSLPKANKVQLLWFK